MKKVMIHHQMNNPYDRNISSTTTANTATTATTTTTTTYISTTNSPHLLEQSTLLLFNSFEIITQLIISFGSFVSN